MCVSAFRRVARLVAPLALMMFAPAAGAVTETVLVTADVTACGSPGAVATAGLIRSLPKATLLTVGDLAYPKGTPWDFPRGYDPVYGRFWSRTRPTLGNDEFRVPNANGYFGYFSGKKVGAYGKGWYAADVGRWRLYFLNSSCWVGIQRGCRAKSDQYRWLAADLARSRPECPMAVWHHPRKSSTGAASGSTDEILRLLYSYHLDVLVNGHAHLYERFEPMMPDRVANTRSGFQSFIVGTGGYSLHAVTGPVDRSVVRNDKTFGVSRLDLSDSGFARTFLPVAGKTFTDAETGSC